MDGNRLPWAVFLVHKQGGVYLRSGLCLTGIFIPVCGVYRKQLSFRFRADASGALALAVIVYSALVYPLIGALTGHGYPGGPTFGVPCPTTIFTFVILMMGDRKVPLYLLIIPVAWALIALSAALSLGIPEDFGLILAALMASVVILMKNRINCKAAAHLMG